MSKIGIITETNGLNLGNSLQNYALQYTLKSLDEDPYTIIRNDNYQHLSSIVKVIFLHNTLKRIIALTINYNNYRKIVWETAKKKLYMVNLIN